MAALFHIHPKPFGNAASAASVAPATEAGGIAMSRRLAVSTQLTDGGNARDIHALVARYVR
jgi:hypothetical protein